ncbi:MAG: hypothetical protein KDC38_10490 [Planctomycetes bacterium]|nr:hypothetical protein [Planctomycetota bacterium]
MNLRLPLSSLALIALISPLACVWMKDERRGDFGSPRSNTRSPTPGPTSTPTPPSRRPIADPSPLSPESSLESLPRDDLRSFLRSKRNAFETNDVGAVQAAIQEFIDRAGPGLGDDLLDLLINGELEEIDIAIAHAMLKSTLTLWLAIDEERPDWFGSRDALVQILVDVVAGDSRSWGPLHDLLFMDGLVGREHLELVADAARSMTLPRATGRRWAQWLNDRALTADDETGLVEWTRSPHVELRRAGYAALLRIDPERVTDYTDRLVHGDRAERSALFGALCETIAVDRLPFVLLELHDRGVDIDLTDGLPTYLRRTGGDDFGDLLYLHGEGRDSDHYRQRAIASASRIIEAESPSVSLTRELVRACLFDPAPAVRGQALITLSLCWDHRDREGFERLVKLHAGGPELESWVESARSNFSQLEELRQSGYLGPASADGELLSRVEKER